MNKASIVYSAVLALLTPLVVVAAAPTQADFDACNSEVKAKLGVPAASPGTTEGTSAAPRTTAPGTAGPSTAPGPGSTTGPGSTAGPQVGAAEAGLMQGIAEAGRKDPAYQKFYAECMKQRGF
jgi:hypothetical protein